MKRACYSFSISIRNWGTLTLESGLDLRFLDESVLRVTSLSSWIFTSPKHVRPNADARPPKKKSCTPALRCRPAKVLVKTVWLRSVGLSAVVLARGVQLPCPISHLVTDPSQPSLPVVTVFGSKSVSFIAVSSESRHPYTLEAGRVLSLIATHLPLACPTCSTLVRHLSKAPRERPPRR